MFLLYFSLVKVEEYHRVRLQKPAFILQRVIGRMYRNELSGALSKTVLALTPLNRLSVFIADRCE